MQVSETAILSSQVRMTVTNGNGQCMGTIIFTDAALVDRLRSGMTLEVKFIENAQKAS